MRTFCLLVAFLIGTKTTLGGIVQLTPEEEEQRLEEFSRLCLSGNIGENGVNVDGVQVYCKMSTAPAQEFTSVHSTSSVIQGTPSQSVYVRPPPLRLVHKVNVAAEIVNGKTNVLVIPPEVDNTYDVGISPQAKLTKPAVSYLAPGPKTETSGGYSYSDASTDTKNEGVLPLQAPVEEEPPKEKEPEPVQEATSPKPRNERTVVAYIIPSITTANQKKREGRQYYSRINSPSSASTSFRYY